MNVSTKPRTKFLDYDARREPKTDHYCVKCQRDIKPGSQFRMVHIVDGGGFVLHPEDESAYASDAGDMYFFPIGTDCARQLGLEWTTPGFVAAQVPA